MATVPGLVGDDKTYTTTATTYFRACVSISSHTSSTWTKQYLHSRAVGGITGIGPHTATLSPGAWSCGDNGIGPVRISGTASARPPGFCSAWTWTTRSSAPSSPSRVASVDTTFTPGTELSLVEYCVRNTGTQTISVSFERLQV